MKVQHITLSTALTVAGGFFLVALPQIGTIAAEVEAVVSVTQNVRDLKAQQDENTDKVREIAMRQEAVLREQEKHDEKLDRMLELMMEMSTRVAR